MGIFRIIRKGSPRPTGAATIASHQPPPKQGREVPGTRPQERSNAAELAAHPPVGPGCELLMGMQNIHTHRDRGKGGGREEESRLLAINSGEKEK